MADENEGLVDLWGAPWTPEPDPRGRKRHKRSSQVAEQVSLLCADGLSVEQIASRLGLSAPTLRKYYFREIEDGAAMITAVLVEVIYKKALAGNVQAARLVFDRMSKSETRAADRKVRGREVREAPIGKKAERQQAARQVGGRFATPAPPLTLAVNNDA